MARILDRNDFRRIFEGGRLPVIRQAEAAECGLACLVMAANYFGHGTSMSEMRRRFSTSLKGTTLNTLMEMGHSVGLSSRAVRLELHEIGQLKTPAILHWDLNHYVVLKGVGRRSIVIHDPGLGERAFSFESASRHFTGVALELTPTPAFQKRQIADRVEIGDLFRHV